MSLKEAVLRDNGKVFLNLDDFGELHTIEYDGGVYHDVPAVLTTIKEKDRNAIQGDHAEGIYLATHKLHCKVSDIGGEMPEKGMRLKISEAASSYMRTFKIQESDMEMGMLNIRLEAYDE